MIKSLFKTLSHTLQSKKGYLSSGVSRVDSLCEMYAVVYKTVKLLWPLVLLSIT